MSAENLTPERMAKAKTCESLEEPSAFAEDADMKLSDDMLSRIAGGIDMPVLPDERIDDHGLYIS